MAQSQQQLRNLKDLLSEDQEPFHLPNYIADKRSSNLPVIKHNQQQQPKQHPSLSPLHLQQLQKQSRQNASFPSKLCAKTACFLTSSFPTDSPADGYFTRSKSPILLSPHKGTVKSPPSNSLFLHVPAKTAALLLEAALRIQRNSNSHTPAESKPAAKLKSSSGFGLLGSVIRRITRRNRTRKLVTNPSNPPTAEIDEDVVRWADSVIHGNNDDNNRIRRRKSNATPTSGGTESTSLPLEEERFDLVTEVENGRWSDEKKLKDLGSSTSTSLSSSSTTTTTSTSSCSNSCCSSHSRDESDEEEDAGISCSCLDRAKSDRINGYDEEDEDFTFCLSPFRVAIYKTPSPDPVSEFSSPVRSPSRFDHEENTTISVQDSFSSVVQDLRQQGSSREGEEEEEDKEQNSPVSVLQFDHEEYCHGNDAQRPNQHLLHKLTKFNNLADNLKPVELDFDDNNSNEDSTIEGFGQKPGIKRLISDLIFEEYERAAAASQCGSDDSSLVVKRVCKKLESWDEIKPDTINIMVELDLKREGTDRNSEWTRRVCKEEDRSCVAKDVEVLIFSVLVDQLICELIL